MDINITPEIKDVLDFVDTVKDIKAETIGTRVCEIKDGVYMIKLTFTNFGGTYRLTFRYKDDKFVEYSLSPLGTHEILDASSPLEIIGIRSKSVDDIFRTLKLIHKNPAVGYGQSYKWLAGIENSVALLSGLLNLTEVDGEKETASMDIFFPNKETAHLKIQQKVDKNGILKKTYRLNEVELENTEIYTQLCCLAGKPEYDLQEQDRQEVSKQERRGIVDKVPTNHAFDKLELAELMSYFFGPGGNTQVQASRNTELERIDEKGLEYEYRTKIQFNGSQVYEYLLIISNLKSDSKPTQFKLINTDRNLGHENSNVGIKAILKTPREVVELLELIKSTPESNLSKSATLSGIQAGVRLLGGTITAIASKSREINGRIYNNSIMGVELRNERAYLIECSTCVENSKQPMLEYMLDGVPHKLSSIYSYLCLAHGEGGVYYVTKQDRGQLSQEYREKFRDAPNWDREKVREELIIRARQINPEAAEELVYPDGYGIIYDRQDTKFDSTVSEIHKTFKRHRVKADLEGKVLALTCENDADGNIISIGRRTLLNPSGKTRVNRVTFLLDGKQMELDIGLSGNYYTCKYDGKVQILHYSQSGILWYLFKERN